MTRIQISDYISNGFSQADADAITPRIEETLLESEPFILDFEGVQFFTTLFFSAALTHLIGKLNVNEYKRLIHIKNLTASGEETYNHALEYAIDYFKKTPQEQARERIIINGETENV